jgi:hypothetical protein
MMMMMMMMMMNLVYKLNNMRVIKSRRVGWVGRAARKE